MHMSSAVSTWTFETHLQGEPYLNEIGLKMLKQDQYEVFRPVKANAYNTEISDNLKDGDIIYGPVSNEKYKVSHPMIIQRECNLYKATIKDKQFMVVENSLQNIQASKNLELFDFNWFKFKHGNKKIYFYSRKSKNVCQVSVYWTAFGESYLQARRKRYMSMNKNPWHYGGPSQINEYRYYPRQWVNPTIKSVN